MLNFYTRSLLVSSNAINRFLKTRWFYPLVFVACALPLVRLLKEALPVLVPAIWPDVTMPWTGNLGVNPVETLTHSTGRNALRLLLLTLLITPIRRFTGWNRVQLVRRMTGVWSFAYALCHFLVDHAVARRDPRLGFFDAGGVSGIGRPHPVAHDLLHRQVHIEIVEPVAQPNLPRGIEAGRHAPPSGSLSVK